jgi:Tat protein translocase TatB subunit
LFRIGLPEIIVILVVVLIFVNPKEFPGIFRKLGKFVQQMKNMRDAFKRSLDEVKATINTAMSEVEPAPAEGESGGNREGREPPPSAPNPAP